MLFNYYGAHTFFFARAHSMLKPALCMQRNLVISPDAARSSIEITEIDLGSVLFVYNNVFIALLNYMQYTLAFTY